MNHLKRGMVLGFVLLWACSGGSGGTAGTDPGTDAIAPSDEAPDGIGPDTATSEDAPDAVRPDLSGGEDVPATDLPAATDESPGDAPSSETTTPTSCAGDTDCGADMHCCTSAFGGGGTCYATSEQCPGGGFTNCTTNEECSGNGNVCCDFYGAAKMCMPDTICPGAQGGCAQDSDCKTAGQVCCKFGDMAKAPTCMADAMCPKNCVTSDDCPSTQECCDLNKSVVCVDIGQCPQKCFHSTTECPLGQACCDSGDGLLVCVASSQCPGSVACTAPTDVCKNSQGEANGDTCCAVPELGFRCVGSGGCDTWQTCATSADCPTGRECCALQAGLTCVPTGACPVQGPQLPPCQKHADCTTVGDVCCIVPGTGTVCAPSAQCPSQCLTDADCSAGICCIHDGSAASCQDAAQCEVGKTCTVDGDCSGGNTCCDMGSSKSCMPAGQCMGKPCSLDGDCPEGDKCCTMFGQAQKICFPTACP